MNDQNPSRPHSGTERPRLLIYCLLLSLTLHILLVLLLPLFRSPEEQPQQPTIVRLVDKPVSERQETEKPSSYEIDPLPVKPEPQLPVESFRKADRDQSVEREQAPVGDDVRDQAIAPPRPTPQTSPPRPAQPAPQPPQSQTPSARTPPPKPAVQERATETTPRPASPVVPQTAPTTPLSRDQLLPDSSTLDRIASGRLTDRNRVKKRDDVEIGDTVWLNLQHDLLVSFFRRFHDQVERVWNYPTEAAMNGIEGTLELLITVNREGELLDVDLRQTSGSDLLDFEAIQAVYRAAPFGPLTSHYPHEELHIRAHFRYTIVGRYIYGQ